MNTIEINGKEYPFRLGWKAIKRYMRNKGSENLDEIDLDDVELIAKEAINAGYEFEGKEDRVTVEDIENGIDADIASIKRIQEAAQHGMENFTKALQVTEGGKITG